MIRATAACVKELVSLYPTINVATLKDVMLHTQHVSAGLMIHSRALLCPHQQMELLGLFHRSAANQDRLALREGLLN